MCRSYNIDRENEHLTGYAIYTHMNNPLGTTTIQILFVSCRKQISAKLRTADIFTLLDNTFLQTKNEQNRNFDCDREFSILLDISGPSLFKQVI